LAGAETKNTSSNKKPSSYAPRAHNAAHVYGSPIGRPAIHRGHSSKRHMLKSPKPRTMHKSSSKHATATARDSHKRIKRSNKAKTKVKVE
jgi:hypothetical protein